MNATHFALTCTDSYPGSYIGLSVIALQFCVILPTQIWVVWLGTRDVRTGGSLAASDIFTVNLSVLEILTLLLFDCTLVAYALNYAYTFVVMMLFTGSYTVGRPFTYALICVERYVAVAHPATYRNPTSVKYRYIGAGLAWPLTVLYGGFAVLSFPSPPIVPYIISLTINLLLITACSLGVLKILSRPGPGESQKEGKHQQKKRAFVIITCILVCISVAYGMDLFGFSMMQYMDYDTFCVLLGFNMWLVQGCSLIQPLLYLSKLGKFSWIKKACL